MNNKIQKQALNNKSKSCLRMNKNFTFLFTLFENIGKNENHYPPKDNDDLIFKLLDELNFKPAIEVIEKIKKYSKDI